MRSRRLQTIATRLLHNINMVATKVTVVNMEAITKVTVANMEAVTKVTVAMMEVITKIMAKMTFPFHCCRAQTSVAIMLAMLVGW